VRPACSGIHLQPVVQIDDDNEWVTAEAWLHRAILQRYEPQHLPIFWRRRDRPRTTNPVAPRGSTHPRYTINVKRGGRAGAVAPNAYCRQTSASRSGASRSSPLHSNRSTGKDHKPACYRAAHCTAFALRHTELDRKVATTPATTPSMRASRVRTRARRIDP
jgi:hypothetical protein